MWIVLIVLVLAAVAGTGYYLRRPRPLKEDPAFSFRCPQCQRKLRNRMSRIGHRARCPGCKQLFVIPSPMPDET